jgi:hypothetical protein
MRTAIQVALGSSASVRRSASPISYVGSGQLTQMVTDFLTHSLASR